jgi:ricin-type beta-trefoil lectin protein
VTRFLSLAGFLVLGAAFPLAAQAPVYNGCPVFPSNNVWNTRVDALPVDANSAAYVNTIGVTSPAHPDFGSAPGSGIPVNVVSGSQPKVNVNFYYAGDSDAGPYPIPANPDVEGGSDRHILIVDNTNCIDYEIYNASQKSDGSWSAGSGAIYSLNSNQLRKSGSTSADAAGLPILPGLLKYDEVAAGVINHAIRFTAPMTADHFIWPARHSASSFSGSAYPPMGQRFRLKQGFDVSTFAPHVQTILKAMKTYGIILADNGAPWFVGGVPDSRWNDDELHQLTLVTGTNFEAVDESSLMTDPNSAQAGQSPTGTPSDFANKWVRIVSKISGKCLEVPSAESTTLGAPLDQRTCSSGSNQTFELTPAAVGYKITIQSSNMQLDVFGGPLATQDGAPVIQYPFWGGTNQEWSVNATADGYFTLIAVNSGKCLDDSGMSLAEGAAVIQWACWGGDNQKWSIKQ